MSMIPQMSSTSTAKKFTYNVIPDGEYEARIVRFIGLGVHKQDPWTDPKTKEVKEKQPAFRADVTFELIGQDATGVDSEGKPLEARPACQFKTYPVNPRAKNSGMLDLCKMIDPSIQALKGDLNWFKEVLLGQPVNITIGNYTNKAGEVKNKIVRIDPIPAKYRGGVGEARTDLVFFEPYATTDENVASYNKIYPYQRNLLVDAMDAKNIPLAGKEVEKAASTEMHEPKATVETIDKEPNVALDDDIPFAPVGLQEGRNYLYAFA